MKKLYQHNLKLSGPNTYSRDPNKQTGHLLENDKKLYLNANGNCS